MIKKLFPIILVLLLANVFLFGFITSCSKEASVDNIILSSDFNASNQPIGTSDSFSSGQNQICCFVTLSNITSETKVSARWLLIQGDLESQKNIELNYQELSAHQSAVVRFTLLHKDQLFFPRGQYEVVIYLNGLAKLTSHFTVNVPSTPPVIQIIDDEIQAPIKDRHVEYSWQFKGVKFNLDLDIPSSLYQSYSSKTRIMTIDPLIYSLYVSHPDDDEYLSRIADAIKSMSQKANFSSIDYLKNIIKFVRSIKYAEDFKSTGFDEYPKYPLETLFDGTGDCEDSAILLASILQASDIPCVLLLTRRDVIPGHCAVGIKGEGSDLVSYLYEGNNYFYVEATNVDLGIGNILPNYIPEQFSVVPLNPLPSLSYDFSSSRINRVYMIRVYVKNIGSTKIYDIEAVTSIKSESGDIITEQTSNPFSLSTNQHAIVTYYLPYSSPGIHEIKVYCETQGSKGYSISSTSSDP